MQTYDVTVVGGGPGGVPAAVAAAREGAKTLLVERYGYLGGMATAGLVNPFMGYWVGKKPLVAGIFAEINDRLRKAAGLHENNVTFDEEILKLVLDDIVRESGVDVLFHSTFVSAKSENGAVKSVTLATKGGLIEASAKVFIDATGDADLAAGAGATVEVGRTADGLCQPMTLCFRIAGIDRSKTPGTLREIRNTLNAIYVEARKAGEVSDPREDVLLFPTLREDCIHFNMTRVQGLSAVDAEDLSRAEFEGRRQTRELVDLFRRKAPGFENAYLQKMGALTGVRESRRVMGSYVLTADDVTKAAKFPDAIACSCYPIDIHDPTGAHTVIVEVPEGDWYEIPYRSVVPSGILNLLMAGRAISATHEAHASLRVMPTVAAIGQAAGTAAAMAAAEGVSPARVDAHELRAKLRAAGAFVGEGE